jgi:hypothetical protein
MSEINNISQPQASYIGKMVSWYLEGTGFQSWVPGWSEPTEGLYHKEDNPSAKFASQHAADFLAEAGVTFDQASETIKYLRRMKKRSTWAAFQDRLGLAVATPVKAQAPQALDVQAIVAAAVAQALAQQAQAQQVVNGTPLEEVTPEDEPEQEVEAADSEGSDGPPLPF